MIVPCPSYGLPESIAQAATGDVFAAITTPAPFDAHLDPSRCLILIPMAAGNMKISEGRLGTVGHIRRSFSFNYLPSGTVRRVQQSEAIEHLYISITAGRTAGLLSKCGSRKWSLPNRVLDHRHSDVVSASQMIRRHLLEPSCPNSVFLTAVVDMLLSHAIGSTVKMEKENDASVFTNGALRRVLEEIDRQIESGIRISNLALYFGMTPSAFSRKFRASTGCTPQRYVIERRIGQARELLKTTEMPICEIAYALGFSSQAHLTSSFKELLGVTPGKYRKAFSTADSDQSSH